MVNFSDLIGTPFQYGGRGPDAYDCYGLVMECARRDGIILPDFGFANDHAMIAAMMGATLPQWREIEPRHGAVVLMRTGRFISHVGYQLGPSNMIHAWEHSGGATIERLADWRQRIIGFYEYVG